MSEQNDDAPPPQPPDEPPPSSPFPESSLTPPPLEEPPSAPLPPTEAPPVAAPPLGIPSPAPPPAVSEPLAPGPPMPPSVPDPLAPAPPIPPAPPEPRPWMETPPSAPTPPVPAAPEFPAGYTSPPPPGAGFPARPTGGAISAPAPGTHVLAGWWRRVGAAIIDGIIISAVAFLIMTPLGIGLFAGGGDSEGGVVALVLGFLVAMLVIAVVALAYAPLMMGRTNGKTLGRMATGIRVVRADGKPITVGFAAVREVAVKALLIGAVAGSVTFSLAPLLDVLWPLWDDENRALHDFVVNTRTVMD